MKSNKPKQVQKPVTERPRGSQTIKSHAHTKGQTHAQLIVLQDCELHICSWGTVLAVHSERQYLFIYLFFCRTSAPSHKIPFIRQHMAQIHTQNLHCSHQRHLQKMVCSSASGMNSQGNMFLLLQHRPYTFAINNMHTQCE
jgi:hypothetical protein